MKNTPKTFLRGLLVASGIMTAFAGAATATTATSTSLDPAQSVEYQEEFNERVYEAILANPKIIFEAIDIARAEEAAIKEAERKELLAKISPMLTSQSNAPVLGNPDGDVTVVEFYDYNCPYCKKVSNEVKALIASDKNVRVVMREFPILGDTSTEAATVALAARGQGRFEDVHMALMAKNDRLKEGDALLIAEDLGLDMTLLEQDMKVEDIERHVDFSKEVARILGITGTPAFIIGTEIIPGAVGVDQLQEFVDQTRKANKK